MSALPHPRASVQARPSRHGTCRLQLSIGQTVYSLVPPHGAVTAWGLKKHGKPASRYSCHVAAGAPGCTCPDFTHRKVICKHLAALRACGILSFPVAPPPRKPSARKGKSLLLTAGAQGGGA
jgi:SWIM zinc finger